MGVIIICKAQVCFLYKQVELYAMGTAVEYLSFSGDFM